METINSITISSPEVGRFSSFLYCIYITKPSGVVYIGETNAKNGPLGRLSGHMQLETGTFLKRCLEMTAINIDQIDCHIHMLTINLNKNPEFCGDVNKPNRLALEYFVHTIMEEYSVDDATIIPFEVISKVKIANRNITNQSFKKLAADIANAFYTLLPFHGQKFEHCP